MTGKITGMKWKDNEIHGINGNRLRLIKALFKKVLCPCISML